MLLEVPLSILPRDVPAHPDVMLCVNTFHPLGPSWDDKTKSSSRASLWSALPRRPDLFVLLSWPAASCLVWGWRISIFSFSI